MLLFDWMVLGIATIVQAVGISVVVYMVNYCNTHH